jgi:division protein CdvB (Snf7/Vps24/ESCRT-III family)
MAEGEIKTYGEMDIKLTEKMTAIGVALEFIKEAQERGFADVNGHLAKLNGKVLTQEKELDSQNRRLNDLQLFKDGVEKSSKEKADESAKKVAQDVASIRSVIVSVITFVTISILGYFIIHFFHFNPFGGN